MVPLRPYRLSCGVVVNAPGTLVLMTGYLDIAGIAARIGVKPNSVQVYHTRANRNRRDGTVKKWDLPAPDASFGRTPVWKVKTIERWEKVRPGTNTTAATAARRK